MTRVPDVTTERLLLRHWRASDREPFAALNADPEVMEHFPAALDRAGSDAMVDLIVAREEATGFLLWAVEVRDSGTFVGFTGLSVRPFTAPFDSPEAPVVEVGWRLARSSWGHGYATEAARAALAYGFGPGGLDEIVSFTSTTNVRPRRSCAGSACTATRPTTSTILFSLPATGSGGTSSTASPAASGRHR